MKPPKLDFGDARSPLVMVPKGSFFWNFDFDPEEELDLFGDAVLATAGIDEEQYQTLSIGKFNALVYAITAEDGLAVAFVLIPDKKEPA